MLNRLSHNNNTAEAARSLLLGHCECAITRDFKKKHTFEDGHRQDVRVTLSFLDSGVRGMLLDL